MTAEVDSEINADPRAAALARLAAQIAEVEQRGAGVRAPGAPEETVGGAGDGSDRLARPATAGDDSSEGGRERGSSRRGRSAGRSRTGGRFRNEPSAPSEDPGGTPETVAKSICLRLLTIAPRPRAGLAKALKLKGIPDEVTERVLDRLTEVGLIDDAAYAAAFVRTKQRDRGLGRTALQMELRRLGVDDESTAQAITQVDSDSERHRAAELVSKRVNSAMAAGSVAARRRLLALLARRGYPADLSVQVVEEAVRGYDPEAT